ncbi:MAG: NAD(P)-dependent oxidoreductase [Verrucomicrobia bacterium]|nr:NAD(P)-dependent oxidoreductase [Verrucomicrobiota bacterium]
MGAFKDKVIFITGASRGIGREIALRAAQDGAKIVITGKTGQPHAKLPGTIHSVAKEVELAGGSALAIQLDVRDEVKIQEAVAQAVAHFGGIDILINNASAISLTNTLDTPMKRYDLMMQVNMRATFATSQACIPHLKQSSNPHILTLSPPLSLNPKWFAPHLPYTMSKYGMSLCTLGMAEEFKEDRIAVNSLWPKTIIATSAIEFNMPQLYEACRKPQIVSDAAYLILTKESKATTGQFFIDEEVLRAHGITDFSQYVLNPGKPIFPDLFIDEDRKYV